MAASIKLEIHLVVAIKLIFKLKGISSFEGMY